MKHSALALMIIFVLGALVGCSKPEYRIAKLEETIKKQEEEIRQLQSKISEQQGEIKQLKPEQAVQGEENNIAEALRKRRKRFYSYTSYQGGDVVKIYIGRIFSIIYFLDAHAENYARKDLDFFLEKSGRETGKIEYYDFTTPSSPQKIFSISGSLYSAETTRY